MMALIWIFMAALEALKWLSFVACIATICWLTKHPHLRDLSQGLVVGAVFGMIITLPRPLILMDLNATMPTRLFYPELFLLICAMGVVFVWAKKQMETRLRTHAYQAVSNDNIHVR